MISTYHIPVMLQPCINALNIVPSGVYVDVTFGGGGHSAEILKHISSGHLYAFDQDTDALTNKINDKRFTLIQANFRHIQRFLKVHNITHVDGILADLGVSSYQFDTAERGFSFRFDAELDMRMNKKGETTAATILNSYSEHQLWQLFQNYGEIVNSKTLASAITQYRSHTPYSTTYQLIESIEHLINPKQKNQYLAQVFQALRIEVNDEMGALKDLLQQSFNLLKPHARLVVLTYHSLEDRLVKNFTKFGNLEGEHIKDEFGNIFKPFHLVNKKPIEADTEEIQNNSRARSAKLRIAEKQLDA